MRLLPRLLALSLVLAVGACSELPTSTDGGPPVQGAVVADQPQLSGGAGYVIVGGANGLPRGLEAAVAAAGGVLTGRADELGVAFAYADDPGFAGALKGVTVVPDLLLSTGAASEAPLTDAQPASIGSDEPFWPYLWGMRAIGAPAAWDDGSTGAGVVVAVLDEGFDQVHPDLAYAPGAQSFVCWQAPGFVIQLTAPPFCESVEYGAGFNFGPAAFPTLSDPFSHATHVSGTISALDNGIGVIGVAPGARVMPVKVLSEYLGGGFTSWIIQGILYAADNGADVINMSLGGTVNMTNVSPGLRDDVMRANIVAYRRAVNYAIQKGVTVVVAAGNAGVDADGDGHRWIRPAEFEGAITVSATAPYGIIANASADPDEPASYTNTGKSLVDFAAPGGDFDYPGPGSYVPDMILSTGSANIWYWSAGTSMASPHVAGVAALIIAENGGSMSPAQVEAELRRRAVDLGKKGNDDFYGMGRVSTGH